MAAFETHPDLPLEEGQALVDETAKGAVRGVPAVQYAGEIEVCISEDTGTIFGLRPVASLPATTMNLSMPSTPLGAACTAV